MEGQAKVPRLGFTKYWSVWPPSRYEITGGMVREVLRDSDKDSEGRHYYPFDHPEIVVELSRLGHGDEASILALVQKWGMLGFGYLSVVYPEQAKLSPWMPHAYPTPTITQDPLEWIWAHAKTVKQMLKMIDLLSKDVTLREYLLKTALEPREALDHEARDFWAGMGVLPTAEELSWAKEIPAEGYKDMMSFAFACGLEPQETITVSRSRSSRDAAKILVSHVLNRNLLGIEPIVSAPPSSPKGFQRDWEFPALLSMVYWHLSEVALGQVRLTQCAWCGSWFEQTHGRQRYCPPDPDKGGAESKCALRARQSKFRTKGKQTSDTISYRKEASHEGQHYQAK